MRGETNLDRLIAAMEPVLHEDTFVFCTTTDPRAVRDAVTMMSFREREGMTLIVTVEEARRLGIPGEFPCRMITLNIHSALEAVGFLARITERLAAEGMGVNPVSAFYHDHLFVPEDRADAAMIALKDLSASLR